jgi:hypothetical protein
VSYLTPHRKIILTFKRRYLIQQAVQHDRAGELSAHPITQALLRKKMSESFRQSPLAKAAATEELDLSRDRSLLDDRFTP